MSDSSKLTVQTMQKEDMHSNIRVIREVGAIATQLVEYLE